MMRRLASLCAVALIAAPSAAGAATFDPWNIAEPEETGPKLKFRLVAEPVISSRPIHDRGMIAQTEVAPNAAIGIGLFKSTPRKRDGGEWRLDERASGSRKAAVRFLFKF